MERERTARLPRTIKVEQRAILLETLKIVPKGRVFVTEKLFDEEAQQYKEQMLAVLKDAGFDAEEKRGPMSFGIPGQWILVNDFQHPPPHAVPLQAAFTKAGVDLDGQEQKEQVLDLDSVLIAVGSEPSADQVSQGR